MLEQLRGYLRDLTLLPGLSGHESRVREYLESQMRQSGWPVETDVFGNCIATRTGSDSQAPCIMVFAHMDSLGFLVRKIEADGFLRLERLGGIPEKALASAQIQVISRSGQAIDGVIGVKAHHVTPQEEKYVVDKYTTLFVDIGARSRQEVLNLGIDIGSPVVYKPSFQPLQGTRAAMSALDDRGGCAVLLALANQLKGERLNCTVHLVGSVQEEYNLRGAMMAARTVKPDAAICLDVAAASDTPDLKGHGDVVLGGGPAVSLYNFHGRGTLNGTIPHPAMVRLAQAAADGLGMTLQRYASTGILTDLAYVQLEGTGVAGIDLGFPGRYAHSPHEVADLGDLEKLTLLTEEILRRVGRDTDFSR